MGTPGGDYPPPALKPDHYPPPLNLSSHSRVIVIAGRKSFMPNKTKQTKPKQPMPAEAAVRGAESTDLLQGFRRWRGAGQRWHNDVRITPSPLSPPQSRGWSAGGEGEGCAAAAFPTHTNRATVACVRGVGRAHVFPCLVRTDTLVGWFCDPVVDAIIIWLSYVISFE